MFVLEILAVFLFVVGAKQLFFQGWSEFAKLSMHFYTNELNIRFSTIFLTKPKWQ